MILDHNQWFYHPEKEAKLFLAGENLPGGWYDTPDKFPKDEKSIDDMTKEELEIYAREYGVELDRRKSKKNMLQDFEDALNDG